MRWKNRYVAAGILAASLTLNGPAAMAADHQDGAAVKTDPSTDINDVYTWMSADGKTTYFVMTVYPAAGADAKFSNAAWYVFHTSSRMHFADTTATPLDIICGFDTTQKISCWVGSDRTNFVSGDASSTSGLTSANGKIKVFAGLRKDHFFFNLDGFKAVAAAVTSAAPTLVTQKAFDAAGCPNLAKLGAGTAAALATQLQKAPGGGAPMDHFLPLNTLAIVLAIDTEEICPGGPLVSVWGATVRKGQ